MILPEERDVLAKIAAMPEPDRGMATRLHAIVKACAPVPMWATGFALKELTPAVEARIAALVKQAVTVVLAAFLLGVQLVAQSDVPTTDPRIATRLTIPRPTVGASEPILIDVDIVNLERTDIRQNQFSPFSSSAGLPVVQIVRVPSGEAIRIPPGLFSERPGVWDEWYLPASGEAAYRVGDFVVPAGARIPLLQGDLRRMIQEAGEYCRRRLAEDTVLAKPEEVATRKQFEDIVRFAGQFKTAGTYDVIAWAYARSNTVRIQIEN